MRRKFALAILTTWAMAWVACSSFEDVPSTPTDEPDATADDGATHAEADAPSDTSLPDATEGDGACTAFFCDGFERDADLANGWTELTTPRFAALSLSDQHPKSGARSMQLVMYGDAGNEAGRTAQLVKELPPGTTRAVLDFWFYSIEPPSTDTTIANVTFDDDSNVIVLMRPAGGFVLAEQYRVDGSLKADNDVGVGSIGNNQARHITLDLGPTLLDGGKAGARLSIDSESKVLSFENPKTDAKPVKVWLGAGYSQPGTRGEDTFYYDDVIIEAKTN